MVNDIVVGLVPRIAVDGKWLGAPEPLPTPATWWVFLTLSRPAPGIPWSFRHWAPASVGSQFRLAAQRKGRRFPRLTRCEDFA